MTYQMTELLKINKMISSEYISSFPTFIYSISHGAGSKAVG
jgi:hypothetical protein